MQGGANDGARGPPPASADRGSNAPPPPPQKPNEANDGGHRRRARRRPQRHRVRVRVRALGVMMAAAAYMILAEALSGESPPAVWMFTAFLLWIMGKWLLLLSYMN